MNNSQELEFEGNLKSIDPKKIFSNEKNDLSGIFLVLAVIYNDIKGLLILQRNIFSHYRKPGRLELTAHAGEFGGINTQTTKLLAGTLHEFFIFLSRKHKLFESEDFKRILAKTGKQTQDLWFKIYSIAVGKNNSKSNILKELENIRNNAAFHYYHSSSSLRSSFRNYFIDNPKTDFPFNKSAYYSIGKGMYDTRFYYADAAVENYLRITRDGISNTEFSSMGGYSRELIRVIEEINVVLASLLKVYLASQRNMPSN